MRQFNIFDMIQDVPPKVGDTVTDKDLNKGVVTSVSDKYIKVQHKDRQTLTPVKYFKYFYKVGTNG